MSLRFLYPTVLLLVALLLTGCAGSESATTSDDGNESPRRLPVDPILADNIWWDGLEGEDVYSWTSHETMPKPDGGMSTMIAHIRDRIGGLACKDDHERFIIEVLVNAEGELLDTRLHGEPKNDACENLVRVAAFDMEWHAGTIDEEPVHAVITFGIPISHLR